MADWEELVDLYTDYLIVVNGQATAMGLSDVLDNEKRSSGQMKMKLYAGTMITVKVGMSKDST